MPNPSLDKAKIVEICLLTTQIHSHQNTSCVLTALSQKAVNLKLLLEFVIYDRKSQSFFLFRKDLNKSTCNINRYFSIITQFCTLQKQTLLFTVTSQNAFTYCTSSFSFCADTEYSSTSLANPQLASHMRLFRNYIQKSHWITCITINAL